MKFTTSLKILFLAIIAFIIEFILSIIFGLNAAFSGSLSTLSGTAFFFLSVMTLTAATGILAPICAVLEMIIKKKNIGSYIMAIILGLIFIGLIATGHNPDNEHSVLTKAYDSVKTGVEKLDVSSERKEGLAYREYLLIKNIQVGAPGMKPNAIAAEIKNTGKKTVTGIEITVYCLDKKGQAVFEKSNIPIMDSSTDALKPNYSRKFKVVIDDAPSEWARSVRISVTDVELSK